MKPGIVIVNTSRGAVMNEAALAEALEAGHVRSAGLDVYEREPEVHPRLLANPRVLLVPHMGTWTVETETKMEEWYVLSICHPQAPLHNSSAHLPLKPKNPPFLFLLLLPLLSLD